MNAPRTARASNGPGHIIAHRARLRRQRRHLGCLPIMLLGGGLVSLLCLVALLVLQLGVPLLDSALAKQGNRPILIMGSDRRPEESGPSRSDLLILVGQNAQTGEAALLSIPRDLWVPIPGIGEQRINTALVFGHDPNDPMAGPRLAMATVSRHFDLPVDRFLLVEFASFVRLVDALGGVEVDVPRPITDDSYPTPDYGVTSIHFDAGPQVMDGERALIYARTRKVDDDFGRSRRQQQVIQAIAARLVQPATWPRLPQAYAALQEGVTTNLSSGDWVAVSQLLRQLIAGQVRTGVLDGDQTTPWITPAGAWVLLPNWPAIRAFTADLFGDWR